MTMSELWESFRSSVMADDAPPIQVQEMRRAFYAGAFGVLTEPRDLADQLAAECIKFKQAVSRGDA